MISNRHYCFISFALAAVLGCLRVDASSSNADDNQGRTLQSESEETFTSGKTSCALDEGRETFTCEGGLFFGNGQDAAGNLINVTYVDATTVCPYNQTPTATSKSVNPFEATDCTCMAVLNSTGPGLVRTCGCDLCPPGSISEYAMDCSALEGDNRFILQLCMALDCTGTCINTYVPPTPESPTQSFGGNTVCALDPSGETFSCEGSTFFAAGQDANGELVDVTNVEANTVCPYDQASSSINPFTASECTCEAVLNSTYSDWVRNCACSPCPEGSNTEYTMDCSMLDGEDRFLNGNCMAVDCTGACSNEYVPPKPGVTVTEIGVTQPTATPTMAPSCSAGSAGPMLGFAVALTLLNLLSTPSL